MEAQYVYASNAIAHYSENMMTNSIKKVDDTLVVTLDVKKVFSSDVIVYQEGKPVEVMSFKRAVGNLAFSLAQEKTPQLVRDFASSSIDLTEDQQSVVITFA